MGFNSRYEASAHTSCTLFLVQELTFDFGMCARAYNVSCKSHITVLDLTAGCHFLVASADDEEEPSDWRGISNLRSLELAPCTCCLEFDHGPSLPPEVCCRACRLPFSP